ncbi:hypothetical protein AZZ85_004970, partial [Klebsiella pneumoniae]
MVAGLSTAPADQTSWPQLTI